VGTRKRRRAAARHPPGRSAPAKGGRPVLIGPLEQARFVGALARGETVEEAARDVGFSVAAVYYRRQREPLFAAAWEMAVEVSAVPALLPSAAAPAVAPAVAPAAAPAPAAGEGAAPGRAKRRLRLTGARRARFLALLARDANLAAAARAALVHVATVYRTAEREPAFAAETAAALARAYDALDAESAAGRAERGARLMAALESPSWAADGAPPPLPDFETVMRRLDRYTRPPPRPRGPRRGARPLGTFDEILAKLEERLARVFGTSEDSGGDPGTR